MPNFKGGLTPVNYLGAADTGQINPYRIKNGVAKNFYAGQPVRVSSNGFLDTVVNTSTPVGVIAEVLWIDGTTKRITRSLYFPSGTSTEGGFVDGLNTQTWGGVIAKVYDNPNQVYAVKADLSVAASFIGQYAQVTNATTGSSYSGRSNTEADVAAAGTSATNALLQIVGIPTYEVQVGAGVSAAPTPDGAFQNTWDVPQTEILVVFARHLYN